MDFFDTSLFVEGESFAVQPAVTADGDFLRVIHVESGHFVGFAHNLPDALWIAQDWVNRRN
jgi:hypothetical protein